MRRALTAEEVGSLTARHDELAPYVLPHSPAAADRIVIALSELSAGYSVGRRDDDEAAARMLESRLRLLAPFPAWAIVKACEDMRMNGVWRDGKFDRRWPPNDAELVEAIRKEAEVYATQHRSARALLEATVEEDPTSSDYAREKF